GKTEKSIIGVGAKWLAWVRVLRTSVDQGFLSASKKFSEGIYSIAALSAAVLSGHPVRRSN
ncbi:hypothetical protein ACSEU3_26415, partial [Pseudomonas aeruginosa]